MMNVRRGGTRGSNQYTTRRRVGGFDPARVRAIQDRREIEAAAWAFTDRDTPTEFPTELTADDCIRFSVHPSLDFRALVASDAACPKEVLGELLRSPDKAVRDRAAKNPALGHNAVHAIAAAAKETGYMDLAIAVLANSALSEKNMRGILGPLSGWAERVEQSIRNPTLKTEWDEEMSEALRNPNCPPDYLAAFAAHPGQRNKVAEHPSCPPDVLADLLTGEQEGLYHRALQRIINAGAAARAAEHPNLPERVLPIAARQYPTSLAAYRYAASDTITVPDQEALAAGPRHLRAVMASNPNINPDVLDNRIARRGQPAWLVASATTNPAASDRMLTRLACHGNTKIERMARDVLSARGAALPPLEARHARRHLPTDPPLPRQQRSSVTGCARHRFRS